MSGFAAVLWYLIWTLALMLIYAFPRVPLVLIGKRAGNAWERSQPNQDPAFLVRAKGAHLNCTENFPLFAALVLVAGVMGKSAVVDGVACYILYARVAQSVTHLIGDAMPLVLLRATLFLVQIALILYSAWLLLH